jgi:hypothetical protein
VLSEWELTRVSCLVLLLSNNTRHDTLVSSHSDSTKGGLRKRFLSRGSNTVEVSDDERHSARNMLNY